MIHPETVKSLLNFAITQELITSNYPLGRVPKGKRNTLSLTKKGKAFLTKKSYIRLMENSDVHDVKIPIGAIEKALYKNKSQQDSASIRFSTLLGPADKLDSEEKWFLVERTTQIAAKKLLAACGIRLIVPKGTPKTSLTQREMDELCRLIVGYEKSDSPFIFLLSYDPSQKDLKTNARLGRELETLEEEYFLAWLSAFKKYTLPIEKVSAILKEILRDKNPNSEGTSSGEFLEVKKLWKEYEQKRTGSESLVNEIRQYHEDGLREKELAIKFANSPECQKLANNIKLN
jgi:hypothetical protein